jgi:hypothetical protein
MKKMFITFFKIKGIIHFELVPQGQRVNHVYYVEILKQLYEAACRKRAELWPRDWIFHYDNAPAHKAPYVKKFLTQKKKSIIEMQHPPYSSDFAPNDLRLFPKIKSALNGQIFQDIEDVLKMTTALKAIHNRVPKMLPKVAASLD